MLQADRGVTRRLHVFWSDTYARLMAELDDHLLGEVLTWHLTAAPLAYDEPSFGPEREFLWTETGPRQLASWDLSIQLSRHPTPTLVNLLPMVGQWIELVMPGGTYQGRVGLIDVNPNPWVSLRMVGEVVPDAQSHRAP